MNTETQDKATTAPAEEATQKHRQTIKGVVVSDKMHKTCVIELKRTLRHRLYQKGMSRRTKVFVHDEKNEAKVGDVVIAIATRPLSKLKNFRLMKIVEKRVGA